MRESIAIRLRLKTIRFAIEPAQIAMFKAIVESYDNLATLRTEDPKLHHLKLYSRMTWRPRCARCSIRFASAFRFAKFRKPLRLDLDEIVAAFPAFQSRASRR